LVLSTLHTNDAAGAISRLIDLGIPPFLVASALLGTAAQRLIRTSCPKCRQAYKPSEQELKHLFGDKSDIDKNIELYRPSGCENCYHTGYQGRKSIYEILCISPEIRRLIMDGRSDQDIKEQAIKDGMKILYENAVNEVLDGVTTMEEIIRIVDIKVV
jgi:type II secretory ATPase GspE/PulE/Tfp pilus assembly ATPase PilB-like protein